MLDDYRLQKEKKQKLHDNETKFKAFKEQFEKLSKKARGIEEKEDDNKEEPQTDEQIQRKVIGVGDIFQKKSKETAARVLAMIGDSNDVIQDINTEIKEQNQSLLEMEDVIKDSQSNLKRAAELVDYFDKAFAKDLFLKIMLFVIAAAILGVIGFSIYYKKTKNIVKEQTAAAAVISSGGQAPCSIANINYVKAVTTNKKNVRCLEYSHSMDKPSMSYSMENPPTLVKVATTNVIKSIINNISTTAVKPALGKESGRMLRMKKVKE